MLALTINGETEHVHIDHKEEAMHRYWAACQAGDKTANLVLVKDHDPDDPPPTAPAAISPIAVERIEEQNLWLNTNGFNMAPPLYAPGTRVVALGDDNYRLHRQAVEEMPLFGEAADAICDRIRDEEREDVLVPLDQVAMDIDGSLWVHGRNLELEQPAFMQLAHLGGFGMGARYLSQRCDPVLRAENVNAQLFKAGQRQLCLRSRLGSSGNRQVFATVTPTYSAVDSDKVLGAVEHALIDAHTELYYDGTGIRGTALWMPDEIVDLAAGDIFKTGVRIETDDTGRGRIRISGVVWRNRCLNLIIIGEGEVETVAAVHRGDHSASSRLSKRVSWKPAIRSATSSRPGAMPVS